METTRILVRAAMYFSLIPVGVAVFHYSRLEKGFRFLLYFIAIYAAVDFSSIYFSTRGINNLFLEYIRQLPGVVLLLLFFKTILPKTNRGLILVLIVLNLALELGEAFYFGSIRSAPVVSKSYLSILVILFGVAYFNVTLQNRVPGISFPPAFWMMSGLLIYHTVTLFAYASYNYFLSMNELGTLKQIWGVMASLDILQSILVAIGFYKLGREKIG